MSRIGLRIAALAYLAALLFVPVGLVFYRTFAHGVGAVWDSVTTPAAISAFWLTIEVAAIAVPLNCAFGVVAALALARGRFPGKALFDALIDLPFAVSPVVIGLSLFLVYGREGWLHLPFQVIFSVPGIVLATIFVSLPFVVRSVQPVLMELDREMEEAATSLGASARQTFARIILPNLAPAIVSGAALAFARAVGEFGSVVLISGNIPRHTEVASVLVFGQIESDAPASAAAVAVELLLVSVIILALIRLVGRVGVRQQ